MKRPFVMMVLPYILGILFAYKIEVRIISLLVLLVVLIVLSIISVIIKKGYSFILLPLFFIVGSLSYIESVNSNLSDFSDEYLTIECKIINKLKSTEDYSTYTVDVTSINANEYSYFTKEKIILRVYEGQALYAGDIVKVKGILKRPNINTNPGLFNYRLYLQAQDIFFVMTTDGYSLDIISKAQQTHWQLISYRFRDYVIHVFDSSLSIENSNIMKSIVLGDDSFLDGYTEDKFRSLGIAHILAVSGLHIGIIFAFVTFLFRLAQIDIRISIIISIVIVWIYGYFIGFPSSVLRASLMFSVLILSTLTYRRYDSLNILALSALVLLLYRPSFVFSMGFQFSFIATASLILFTNRISGLLSFKYNKITGILSPLIAVQIGMLPATVYYFNKYCIFSILSNLLIIPLLSFSLMLSCVMLLISMVSFKLAVILGFLINILINICNLITDMILNIPLLNITLKSMSLSEILIYYLILLILLKMIRIDFLNPNTVKVIFAYLVIAVFLNISIALMEDSISIEFIDVGQGDCSLIRTYDKNILIDSGGTALSDFNVGENIVLPYLRKQGVKKLDAVFISHFHEDHCEGLLSLIDNVNIKCIFIGYNPKDNKLYNTIRDSAEEEGIPIITLGRNDIIRIDKNIAIKVLSQINNKEDIIVYNENNLSLVMLLEAYDKKILFTGDIEKEAEASLANMKTSYDVDVLKVPHHGSKTSSTQSFISYLNAEYAVIQVGKNTFGHPSQEVLERYAKNNVQIYRTDKSGLISVKLDHSFIKILPYLKEKKCLHDIILKYKIEMLFTGFYMGIIFFILKRSINCLLIRTGKLYVRTYS